MLESDHEIAKPANSLQQPLRPVEVLDVYTLVCQQQSKKSPPLEVAALL